MNVFVGGFYSLCFIRIEASGWWWALWGAGLQHELWWEEEEEEEEGKLGFLFFAGHDAGGLKI